MIEIGAGITIGPGIIINTLASVFDVAYFITDTASDFLVSENNDNFIEELP